MKANNEKSRSLLASRNREKYLSNRIYQDPEEMSFSGDKNEERRIGDNGRRSGYKSTDRHREIEDIIKIDDHPKGTKLSSKKANSYYL